ncbi:MAG TPA: helix-turn-helix domain-containing protein [Candidatus Sulfotelmatobacter sp.]|nr:helix-turn-helix domain-containing protein [Candidatus Sulfotelmatobacter sp.]
MPPEVINRSASGDQEPPRSQSIESALPDAPPPSAADEISNSWHRCMADYHVDPKDQSAPNVVTQSELKASEEPVAEIVVQAREEIDRLYAIVRQQGYVVLLCNNQGIAIHHRGDESRADDFKRWGIWLGGVWSEQTEGTNGIGTCITEQRPLLVHCGQHYRSRHSKLTCAGAPIFDALGKLAGVLDVSAVATEGPDRPQQLALAATVASARAVEERLFREHFRHDWIVAALPSSDAAPAMLLALDDDQRIRGADRVARAAFALDDNRLATGIPLSSLFDYSLSLFRRRSGQDIPVLLARTGRNDQWRALITPPLAKSNLSRSWPEAVVHAQPRLSMLNFMPMPEAPDPSRGGLSPAMKNRVCDFIESHISEKISLDALSSMAGLSPHHFARAFQQSLGIPPHRYLLRRRLEHVEQMLRNTQLPLSHIALAVGFSDQSHLNRHFRRLTGMSPSLARGLER